MLFFMKSVFCLLFFVGIVQAEELPVQNQDDQLKLGLDLIQDKKYKKAETYFEELKAQYPTQITYLNNLAVVQMALGKTEKALTNLKAAMISDKYFSVTQKNISDIYAYMASQAYSKALEKQQNIPLPNLTSITDIKVVLEPKDIAIEEGNSTNELSQADVNKKLKELIEAKVTSWAQSWMKGDSKAYISSYSKNFKPADNLSYQDWLAQRRYRLRHSKQVEVSYNQLNVFFNLDKTTAVMDFVQNYKAGTYQDKVRKQLFWQLEDDSWLISREQVVEKL